MLSRRLSVWGELGLIRRSARSIHRGGLGKHFNMADKMTYYEVLGVTRDSSIKEVK